VTHEEGEARSAELWNDIAQAQATQQVAREEKKEAPRTQAPSARSSVKTSVCPRWPRPALSQDQKHQNRRNQPQFFKHRISDRAADLRSENRCYR
jgi:hypothetical protein